MDILQFELKKLGLKEKEAKVYLAGLELGPTSIIQLAERAGITRPTTYEIVSILEKRGLFAQTRIDKRTAYVAQSPETLLGILRSEERALAEREREFLRIISALESRYALNQNGGVRRYHGEGAMNALKERVVTAPTKIVSIIASNSSKERHVWLKDLQKHMGSLTVREISPVSPIKKSQLAGIKHEWKKSLLKDDVPEVWIMPDRTVVIAENHQEGYLLENPLFVSIFQAFFEALWSK